MEVHLTDPWTPLRRRLLAQARRVAFGALDAEDLVQDALLAAWQRRHEAPAPLDEPWLRGVVRRRAAFLARTASRSRRRDQEFARAWAHPVVPSSTTDAEPLPDLPPSLRIVARLALAGVTRPEIRWVLQLRDDTLRQRICALRRRVGGLEVAIPRGSEGRRRPALCEVARIQRQLGSHDPDGHGILLTTSQTAPPRQPPTRPGG